MQLQTQGDVTSQVLLAYSFTLQSYYLFALTSEWGITPLMWLAVLFYLLTATNYEKTKPKPT